MDTNIQTVLVDEIEGALGGGPPIAVATVTGSGDPPWLIPGDKLLIRSDGTYVGGFGYEEIDTATIKLAKQSLTGFPRISIETIYVSSDGHATNRRHQSRLGDAELMVQIWEAPARLIVVGGGHVGLAVATFGEKLDFAVTLIDDREDFANRERFPMAEQVLVGDIEEQLNSLVFDQSAHVVLVSRGHLQDERALKAVIREPVGYLGMIGSQRRTQTVLTHLAEEGYDQIDLEKVSTPVGLDIGAETPEEIALSILAEIVMLRRGGNGGRMGRRMQLEVGEDLKN